MSFYPYILTIVDNAGDPVSSYTQLNLRTGDYSTAAYTQIGAGSNGRYTFGDSGTPMVAGEYKLYDNTTELTAAGIIKIGEVNAVMLTGNQTVAGVKTFSQQAVFNHSDGLQTDKIAEKSGGNGVYIDGIRLKDDLETSNIPSLDSTSIGGNTYVGDNTFESGSLIVGTAAVYTGSGTPEAAVTADIGSIYLRTDGSTSTTLYVKTADSGANTGWSAK